MHRWMELSLLDLLDDGRHGTTWTELVRFCVISFEFLFCGVGSSQVRLDFC